MGVRGGGGESVEGTEKVSLNEVSRPCRSLAINAASSAAEGAIILC